MTWVAIVCMTGVTFINRYAFFAEVVRYQPGARARRFLSYSTYAVLTAIWTPIVFEFDADQGLSHAGADFLIATSLAAILTMLKFRSIVVVLASSTVFFILRLLVFTA